MKVFLSLCLLLGLVACSKTTVPNTPATLNTFNVKVAQTLEVTAKAVGGAQQIVIDGNKAGTISDADTQSVLLLCQRINAAGQQVSDATRKLVNLDPAAQTNILAILQPIVQAVNDAVSNGTAGIKNPTTKANVQAALVAIQTGLSATQVVLSATGGK